MPDRPSLKTMLLDKYAKSGAKTKVDDQNFYGINSNYDTTIRSHRYTDVPFFSSILESKKRNPSAIATIVGPPASIPAAPSLTLVIFNNNQNIIGNDQQICNLDYYQ
jgi:hypothetical protein